MQELNEILAQIDGYIGGSAWFVFLLLGIGLFFTLYLGFPQLRYFGHALRIVRGKFDRDGDEGDTSHFQALSTALSGTVGTGNIAGVAFAIHLGGPAALFWMLVTAFLGMTTKFVEVTLSHKYREKADDGSQAGGPMYYMRNAKFTFFGKRVDLRWMAALFAIATIISSFGTGNLPQINSISNVIETSFGVEKYITGAILAVLLGVVIVGGIKRIAKVTERLVPGMALIYVLGALSVLAYNYTEIIPSFLSIFEDVFSGSAATGGFLGATIAYAFNRGVNRGLFSNEAGQGSAPIAHASARAHEPVSEGMVAILEPFIDTILICTLTGVTLLASGVWKDKHETVFQFAETEILVGQYDETVEADRYLLFRHMNGEDNLSSFNGEFQVDSGKIVAAYNSAGEQTLYTMIHARSIAENPRIYRVEIDEQTPYSGRVEVSEGKFVNVEELEIIGKSLVHSAPLTSIAFTKSWFGDFGQYIVSIGLLLFAFSTAISWSYYGGRAITYLFGSKAVIYYRVVYVIGFFIASFTDTQIVWTFSGIAIALMTIPNLIGIFWLRKEMRDEVRTYWTLFDDEHPGQRRIRKKRE